MLIFSRGKSEERAALVVTSPVGIRDLINYQAKNVFTWHRNSLAKHFRGEEGGRVYPLEFASPPENNNSDLFRDGGKKKEKKKYKKEKYPPL